MNKLLANKSGIILLTGLMAISGSGFADVSSKLKYKDREGYSNKHQQFVYAKVLEVKPLYDIITTSTPTKQCWQEPVKQTYRIRNDHGHGSAVGTLAGGLIGGIIGHQFGKGRGKRVATAMGTLVGAQIGHDNAHESYAYTDSETVSYRDVCEVTQKDSYEKVIDGYQVTYRYKGNQYETRMPYDPGDRVKLKVNVNPVF